MKANGKDGDSENVQPIIKIPPSSDRTENTHRSPAAITSEKKKIREGYQIYVPGRGGLKVKEDRKPKCEYGKAPNELVEKERKKPIKTEAGEAKNEVKKTGKTNDSQLDGRTTKIGSAESDTNESTPSENIKSSERKSRSKSPEKRPNSPRSSMSNNLLPVVNGVAYSSNSNQPSSSTSVEPTVTKSSYGRNCPSLSSCCGEDDFEFPSLRIANGNTGSYRDDYSFDGDQQPSTSQTPRYIPSDLRKQDGITTKVIKQPLVFENSTLKRQDSPHSSRRTDSNENRSRFTLCNSSERYVDTHCHWDFIFDAFQKMKCRVHSVEDLERMFPGAFPTNFGGCIPNIIDPSVLRHHMGWVRAIIENHYTIGMAYGCHPNKAKEWNEDFEKRLADIIQDTDTYKTIALGEFGLDFYKMGAPKEKQLEALRGQLQLALHFEMPIIIHCRGSDSDDAEDLCLAELKGVLKKDHQIHRHCFSESVEVAERWVEAFPNVKFGICPKNPHSKEINRIRQLINKVGIGRILIETDSPFFRPKDAPTDTQHSPVKINMPGYAVYSADLIAEAAGTSIDKVLSITLQNARDLYRF